MLLDRIITVVSAVRQGGFSRGCPCGKDLRVGEEHEAEADCRTGGPSHCSGKLSRVTDILLVVGVVGLRARTGSMDGLVVSSEPNRCPESFLELSDEALLAWRHIPANYAINGYSYTSSIDGNRVATPYGEYLTFTSSIAHFLT